MAKVEESIAVEASLAETWSHYFDARGWGSWVEGFGSVEAAEGYPQEGGTLRWRSTPAGRGTVSERVLEHEPRRLHRIGFEDDSSEGEQTTRFEIEGEATRVSIELSYELRQRGLMARMASLLFVRGQVRGSVARTLLRFKREAEEVAQLG